MFLSLSAQFGGMLAAVELGMQPIAPWVRSNLHYVATPPGRTALLAFLGGLTSFAVASRKSSCSPLPAAASSVGIVRQQVVSMPCELGRRGTVRSPTAAAAASADAKTTFALESFTHSTHWGADSAGVTPGVTRSTDCGCEWVGGENHCVTVNNTAHEELMWVPAYPSFDTTAQFLSRIRKVG